jgi:hypothetical protein
MARLRDRARLTRARAAAAIPSNNQDDAARRRRQTPFSRTKVEKPLSNQGEEDIGTVLTFSRALTPAHQQYLFVNQAVYTQQ